MRRSVWLSASVALLGSGSATNTYSHWWWSRSFNPDSDKWSRVIKDTGAAFQWASPGANASSTWGVAFGIYKTKGVYMNKYKIKASTIMRCIALILVLINQVLAIFGKGLPFADELVYQIASVVLTIVVGIWSAWKNNDFTKAARVAGKVFDSIKDGSISQEEAKELIESADALMTAEEDDEETDEELVSE